MKDLLGKLFALFDGDEDEPARDGLEQPQREALIDLLLLAMYADNHLALSEKEQLEGQLQTFDWRSGTTPDIYIEEATAKVRAADKADDTRDEFIGDISTRLATADARELGLALCKQLFQTDADVGSDEIQFLNQLRSAFQ